jgi:hypothetical protein
VLKTALDYRLSKWGFKQPKLFAPAVDCRLAPAVPVHDWANVIAMRLEERAAA